jgi:hypothetical protein
VQGGELPMSSHVVIFPAPRDSRARSV